MKGIGINAQFEESNNINKKAAQMKHILRKTANESIPVSRQPNEKSNPIWFNSAISKLIQQRQEVWKFFKRCRSLTNVVHYTKLCAMFKRECEIARRKTWENFVNSLNPTMDIRFLWQKVNNLRTGRSTNFPTIFTNGNHFSHPLDIANCFSKSWYSLGSDNAFEPEIIARKKYLKMENPPERSYQFPEISAEITVSELTDVLRTLKGSTPGRNKITYSTIKFAPSVLKSRLCRLYSKILNTGFFQMTRKLPC